MPLTVTSREGAPAARVTLRAGFAALALELQEAAGDLANSDVRSRLVDAIQDAHAGSGQYAYYLDHFGDSSDGDVAFNCGGHTYMCPYEISGGATGTAAKANLDMESKRKVIPRTTYDEVSDDDDADGYASMSEAWRTAAVYSDVPLYERFVSKKERDAADEGDFAGKGKSFPILKPADVMAAVHSMGRAGSGNYGPAALKANIIRIAKKKGWTQYLPKAWQGDGGKEAARPATGAAGLRLVEGAAAQWCAPIALAEAARSTYPVKIISPGTGTMAHYPQEVLERDGPKVIKAGTLMYWNHATDAEEAARPEGDLDRLAAILTKDAVWQANGPKGPGLYSEAKVMADYATKVEERAPFIGLSIRGGGKGSGRTVNGKPELASLDYVESVDYVTRAGRGGMALAEAARGAGLLDAGTPANSDGEVTGMTDAEKQQLKEALGLSQTLLEKERRREAIAEGAKYLQGISLPSAMKELTMENVLREALPIKDNQLDVAKLREAIDREAKRVGAAYGQATGLGTVYGMGGTAQAVDPATIAAREAAEKVQAATYEQAWDELMPGVPKTAVQAAMKGRAA